MKPETLILLLRHLARCRIPIKAAYNRSYKMKQERELKQAKLRETKSSQLYREGCGAKDGEVDPFVKTENGVIYVTVWGL